uniref:ORF67f n=1 Tax=Pinus koraiensis TaxID=88728 RepID=Q85WT5_PINKO|nr:ORF67f [Pinus koraiensis]AAO74134.1 ORF67f [Pinus koraiensis]
MDLFLRTFQYFEETVVSIFPFPDYWDPILILWRLCMHILCYEQGQVTFDLLLMVKSSSILNKMDLPK